MNRIKELRLKKRFTQVELSKLLNVAQNTLSYWESGKTEPGGEFLTKLADILETLAHQVLPFKGITKKDVLTYLRSQKGISRPRQDTDTCKRIVKNHVERVTVWNKEETHIKLKYQLSAGMSKAGGGGGPPAQTYCLVLT